MEAQGRGGCARLNEAFAEDFQEGAAGERSFPWVEVVQDLRGGGEDEGGEEQ